MEITGNITIIEPVSRFKKVDISLIENENIDCTTLGVYTKLIVLGKKWNLNVKGLRKHLGLSDEKVRKSLSLLESEGYIVRTPCRNEKGQLVGWNYAIYPTPVNEQERSQAGTSKENPQHPKPTTPISNHSDNGGLINNRLNQQIDLIDNKEEKDKSFSKKDDLFEECWKAYRRKGSKANAKRYWLKLSDDDKKKVLPHIKAYCSSRELNYQKDFERYLRDRIFENIIVKGNTVIFDPSMGASIEYNPVAGVDFFYNDFYKTWMYIGYDTSFIPDGYNADNRPNGARVTLNNARGVLVWNATDKKWEKE